MPYNLLSDDNLTKLERRLCESLQHPIFISKQVGLELLDILLEVAGALYLVRMEIQRRREV